MPRIMVSGIGTDVGKTLVSAILALLFTGDYWKPIQCGPEEHSDTTIMKTWLDATKHTIHAPAYSLCSPLSPHHAARLENILIRTEMIALPSTTRPLIIEGVGGILVPLTIKILTIDLFASWECQWVIVSKHYLGSINHTLLAIEALKQRRIPVLGLIFNGTPNSDSEASILEISQLPCLGRVLPEQTLNKKTLHKYVKQWQPSFSALLI